MSSLFLDIDDKEKFEACIKGFYDQDPKKISSVLPCRITKDFSDIGKTYEDYQKELEFFKSTIRSRNPDQFKRAAALLSALLKSDFIKKIDFGADLDELDGGFSPVSFHHQDFIHAMPYIKLYDTYRVEIFAFAASFWACSTYSLKAPRFDFDYLETICAFLRQNPHVGVESYFLIFKSIFCSF